MPLSSTSTGLVFGIIGIIALLVLILFYDAKYLEAKVILRWLGEFYIVRIFHKPAISFLLWLSLCAIGIITFGWWGISIPILAFICIRNIFAPLLTKHFFQKALQNNSYDTKYDDDELHNKAVVAPRRIQLQYLCDHPKCIKLYSGIPCQTARRIREPNGYEDFMFANQTSPSDSPAIKSFKTFIKLPQTEKSLVEKELSRHQKKPSSNKHTNKSKHHK